MYSQRALRNINWIETHCHIPDGKNVGKPVQLTNHQKDWIEQIYGTPTRTFLLSIPRKNAKTGLSAFLLLLHLVGPEAKRNGQLYSAAQSRDQAGILFGYASKMVRMSPTLSSYVNIRESAKSLECKELGTFYRALSADASTAYGLSPVFLVHDELGQVRGERSELYDALETASAAHEEPLSIVISTQAAADSDLLSILLDDALANNDPLVKAILHTAPLAMDPFTEEALRTANPHFDVFMNPVEVMKQARDAKRMPSKEPSFRNLILNQRVEAKSPFVSKQVWDSCNTMPADYRGRKVWIGLDLSQTRDLTAMVIVDEDLNVTPVFWLPENGLVDKSKADRVPYDRWHKEGYLNTTPGSAIQYEYVARQLATVFQECDVQAVAFDRWNFVHLKPWLIKAGLSDEVVEETFKNFGQGFVSMSPALRELETQLLEGTLKHGSHPVLSMCAGNAIATEDAAGNRKLDKSKASGRIDGMVALAMALSVRSSDIQEQPKKVSYFIF